MTPRAEFGRLCGTATLALCALAAAGCGKTTAVDLSQYDTGAQGFAVGGTVEGLVGSGLVLRNLGADDLHVSGNGAFSFATRQATGATFRVTVGVQPTGPAQTCAVSSGSGIVGTANVIDILVKCVNAEPVTMTGAITGLTGTGLVLQMNGADDLAVASTSTSFTFATQLPKGTPYALTIKKQPSNPLQTCTVTNGTGLVGLGGDLSLSCSVNPSFSISGTISGYVGSGLVLAQGTETLAIAPSSTTFALVNPVQEGARWFVQVRTQPSAPRQTCVVSTPAGTMGSAPITDLVITCTTNATFKLGGVVQGLQGTGLVLKTDLGDTVAPAADGTFSFPQKLQSATPYTITVAQQPVGPAQTCTIEGDTGVVGSADVTDVRVECLTDPYYAIGGTLTGLAGVRVILQNEGADDLELDFDGPFQFATTAQNGTPFHVTVKTQPADPLQRCDIDGADGKVDGDVTSVNVTCTTLPYFNIGGMVTGLLGQGLILENLGGDDLAITKNGQFVFATQQQTTLPYSVTVRSQPFGPYQLCTVTAGDGTVADADVLSVNVVCATSPFFDVGGTVSGLTGSGLVLQNDGGDDLLVSATGTFHFATQVQENVPYLVTIKTQPANPNQTCTLTNAGGVVGAADVTSVHVACADNPKFSLGGSVSGLTGAGLVLHASTGENLAVTSTGAFTFAQKLQGGTRYRVSVGTQPSGQTCSVTAHGEGTIAANVGNVQVVCGGAARYSLGVQVSGLTGSGLLLTTASGDELAVNSAGTSTFADSFADGAGYAVTVTAQPGAPQQLCAFDTASAGTFAGADVLLPITCTTQPFFTIGGVVTGNAGQGLTLLNAGEQLVVSGNGAFAFSTLAQSGTPYDITVAQQPNAPLQTCIVTGGHGVVAGANPGGISVNCTTNTFFLIGGSVSGVVGTGLVLQNNGADDHTITQDGFFIFSTNLQAGRTFAVSVKTQPNNPPQTCTVNNGSGVVTRNMVSAQIVCAKNPTSVIGGTVSGLTGSGLVLQDNGVDPLTITGNGGFGFATALNLGATYSVTVRTQPTNPSQTCRVVNGAGRTAGTNVNSVTVTCSPVNFKVGGFVSGLPAGAKVNLLDNGFDALTVSGTSTGATDVTYSFGTSIASGRAYTVTVTGQSGGVSCSASDGSTGTVGGANVTAAHIVCIPAFTVGGTLSNLAGTGLVLTNSTTGESIAPAKGATTFTFLKQVNTTQGYSITATAQPLTLAQTCANSASTGTPPSGNPSANVTDIAFACTTSAFAVGGVVNGLPAGSSVTLLDNGADSTTINGSGTGAAPIAFAFPTPVVSGQKANVTIGSSAGPVSCTLTAGASTTIGNAPINPVVISCVPTFAISGTLSNVVGSGLVLKNVPTNETLAVSAGQTSFAFTKGVTAAQGYNVQVSTQPASPAQVCGPSGARAQQGIPSGDLGDLAFSCANSGNAFTVGGSITGLPTGTSVSLQNNGLDTKTVNGTGAGTSTLAFTFATSVGSGNNYSVTVSATTGAIVCSVAGGGSGTVSAAVSNVQIACAPGFSLGGTIATLTGTGLTLTNATTGETIAPAKAATTFAFSKRVSQAQGYDISITGQPLAVDEVCDLSATSTSALSGNPSANVSDIGLVCVPKAYAVGGTITGLPSGASVTLQDNAADDTLVNGSGDGSAPISFSFATPIKSGAAYAVTVTGSAGPASCKIASGGSGTIGSGAVTNVALTCVPAYSIGGTISGLSGSGAVLKNNTNGETLALAAGQTSFVFSKFVTTALGYSVSVTAQPSGPTQSCAVSTLTPAYQIGNPTANVTGIAIVCTTSLFSIGGSVTGLSAGTSLIMNDNGGDPRTVSGTSTGATPVNFTFGTTLSSGATYTATIFSVTGNVTCGFAAGTDTGTVGAANVTSIQVQCAPAFTLAGTISGYIGAGLTLLNSTTNERVVVSPGKTTFAFKTPVSAALGYAISAATQPVNPAQTCSPSGGSAASGTPGGNLTDIGFACGNNTYSIGGVVNGLALGTSVTLSNNGDEAVRVSVATAGYPNFVFPTSLTSGQTYTVTVAQQPPGQLCVPRAGTSPGLVGGANVTGVIIDCAPTHTLRGKVRGLTGSGLTITDGLDQLPLAADAGADVPFVFPTPLAKGAAYDLNVLTLPVNPAQTCSVTGGSNGDGSGVMGDTDVTDLLLVCGTPSYKIGGTVLGAATGVSAAMVITNNGGDSLVFAASSTATGDPVAFSMPTPQAPSSTYSIAVLTPPSGLVCLTRNASGVVGNGDVTDVLIVCGYPITGTFDTSVLSGTPGQIPSSGLALQSTVGFETWSDSETLAVAASSTSFTFLDPAPRSGVCGVSVLTNPSRPAMVCTVSAPSGCNGAAIPGPLALKVRCVEQIELVPFTGATGSLQAVSTLGSGEVFAGGAFTGAVDLGHGARTGSAFSALGSGFLQGLDQNGTRGAGASPAGANFDEEFPSRNAAADQGAAIVRASVVTPSGALIIGGNFSGSVDFGDGLGPVAAASSSSMFLARVGVSGGVVWARQFGSGTISELAANGTQIAAGGVYGAAAASSEQFGNVACALTASSAHRDFVATFNETDGACRFAIDLAAGVDANSTTSFRIGPALAFDSQGNLLTAGVAQDTSGVNALKGSYIATYDATGKTPCIAGGTNNELFFDATTSTNQGITAITAGATDSVIVGGFCRGAPKVHTKATTCNSTASSAALVRYSARTACSSGQLVGTGTGGAPLTFISTGGSAKVLALTADASGNEAALGVYSGTSTWVGTAFFAGAGSESQNLFVARFPAALTAPTVQTLSSTGSVTPSSISLGALGSTWVAGAYNGSLTYRTNPALGSTAASPEPLLVRFPAGPP